MSMRLALVSVLALSSALGAGAAQARDVDVRWSVTIGSPGWGYGPAPVYVPAPVYLPQPVYRAPRPVYVLPQPVYYHRAPVYWDRDRDGIPNRYDRHYNPYGDRDRDGVPNRWDRDDRNPYRR
jgi:hypothetical protein